MKIRKAYGNWTNPTLKPLQDLLHEFAIQPVQQFDLTKGKNATDIALVIDVMDILYTKDIDVICLVSSDGDFTPLVTKVLEDEKEEKPMQKQPKSINSDTRLINLLRHAIYAVKEDDGWAMLGPIGTHI